eukprot:3941810-Rhodomonas_salina.4
MRVCFETCCAKTAATMRCAVLIVRMALRQGCDPSVREHSQIVRGVYARTPACHTIPVIDLVDGAFRWYSVLTSRMVLSEARYKPNPCRCTVLTYRMVLPGRDEEPLEADPDPRRRMHIRCYDVSSIESGCWSIRNVALLVAIGFFLLWGVTKTIQQMQHMVRSRIKPGKTRAGTDCRATELACN